MSNNYKNQFGRANQAENYLKYRPKYSEEFLGIKLLKKVEDVKEKKGKVTGIDIACGSGQLTFRLLPFFDQILGVDVNTQQLENAILASQKIEEKKKIDFLKCDSTKVDELLKSDKILSLDPSFVFIAQAFHWFDFKDFLTRFTHQTKEKNVTLVIVGYTLFELTKDCDSFAQPILEWEKTINPYFQFHRPLLDTMYIDMHFQNYFKNVEFVQHTETVKDQDIRSFIGYLDTWSAYRNYLEKVSKDPSKDPLLIMMKQLGLKNYESKHFDQIEIPESAPSKVHYNITYFMYICSN